MIESSESADDPLSDLLQLADARPVLSGGFSAGGDWALRFPDPGVLKFFAIERGACWLQLEHSGEVIHLNSGDTILLTSGRAFVMASDLSVPPVDAEVLFADKPDKVAVLGDGRDCAQVGGHVWLNEDGSRLLTEVLPDHIHLTADSPFADSIIWMLLQIRNQRTLSLPGAGVVSRLIASLMFVQMLRAHLEETGSLPPGMLRAFADHRLAPALRLIHEDPSRAWQLTDLAKAAGMSRTAFAVHFKAVAGVPPLTYLARWRVQLAMKALRNDQETLAVLARRLGFSSESAFSNFFKRETGIAPTHFRRQPHGVARSP